MCSFAQLSFTIFNIAGIVILAFSIFHALYAGYIAILGWGDKETMLHVRAMIIQALLGVAVAALLGSADKIAAWFEAGSSLLSSCGIAT